MEKPCKSALSLTFFDFCDLIVAHKIESDFGQTDLINKRSILTLFLAIH